MANTLCASSPQQRAQAELERRRRGAEERKRVSFREFLGTVSPELHWDWPHLRVYREHLEALRRGDIQSLLCFMPPQYGKSTLGTVHFPVHWLSEEPTMRFIIGSYGTTLASGFGRKALRLARQAGIAIAEDKDAAAHWETVDGGGILSVGVGAGVTGNPGDVLIVDDPIKSRKEAESQAHRSTVWDWLQNDFFTRGPRARRLVTLTRWHWDDPAGRILKGELKGDWVVLSLPALAEVPEPREGQPPPPPDPLGRAPGEALCPERQTKEELEKLRVEKGEYVFGSLYQQRPTPRTGNMFPRGKVGEPIREAPIGTRWCRGWDKAGTKDGGKRTAGVKIGIAPSGQVIVGHVVRGQWASLERNQTMQSIAGTDGTGVPIAIEQEPGSGGKESAENSVRQLQGYSVHIRPASTDGDKFARADAFAAQWQAGNVVLLDGVWNEMYLDEMELTGPGATYTDCMDGSSVAYNELTLRNADFRTPRVVW